MAEVNAKDLTTKTSPASTDSMLLFGTTSNEGAKITVDNLADNILSRLSTKTFANQVGGSSAATILAQLSTLNSKLTAERTTGSCEFKSGSTAIIYHKFGNVVYIVSVFDFTSLPQGVTELAEVPSDYRPSDLLTYGVNVNSSKSRQYRINENGKIVVYNPTEDTVTNNGAFFFAYVK